MTVDEQAARAAIAKTLAICTQAGDAHKADAYAGSFAPDGVLQLAEAIEGRAAIHAWMTGPSAIPPPEGGKAGFVSHHLTTCRIDLTSGTTAAVRTYWLAITANGPDHSGYYDDRFVAIGDRWLIAWRKPRTLWISPHGLIAGPAAI